MYRPKILSIGNAVVDVIGSVPESMLGPNGLLKGSMTLVSEAESHRRQTMLLPSSIVKAPGGSAANTAACLASLNAKSTFIGKLGRDELGNYFSEALATDGVQFDTPATDRAVTGHCIAMITPDGERTMSTHLGACQLLGPEDINPAVLGEFQLIYLEGYLFDSPLSSNAVRHAVEHAKRQGLKIAVSLSDRLCVQRNRDDFADLFHRKSLDIVLGNELEMKEFLGADSLETYSGPLPSKLVMTLGARGAAVLDPLSGYTECAARPVRQIVDLVGAGDSFAAGFLYGYASGLADHRCLEIGGLCASELVQSRGPRPRQKLSGLLGLLRMHPFHMTQEGAVLASKCQI